MPDRPGLAALLPIGLACAERHVPADAPPDADGAGLPAERAAIAHAVPTRRAEYLAARDCARRALAELGHPPVAIPTGAEREPVWPAGMIGSLTHCAGYRAAAVGRAEVAHSVGIDAEPDEPLPEGVLEVITSETERAHLAGLPGGPRWDRLLFSAKESVYKAWFPLARGWLGFEDAELRLDPAGGFSVRLLVPGPLVDGCELAVLTGRWTLHRGLVLTAVVVRPGCGGAWAR